MIYILDRLGSVLSVLSNEGPNDCPYMDDSHVETLDGELSYDFTTPADRPESALITEECMVLFRDSNGQYRLCRIKTVDEQHQRGNRVKIVHSEGSHGDLNGFRVRPVTFTGEPIKTALMTLVAGTPWTVGDAAWSGIHSGSFSDWPTVLAAVRSIVAEFALEIEWRGAFSGNSVTSRTCNVVERIGADTGKTFTYRKDIKGLRRTSDSSQLYTALIYQGPGLVARIKADLAALLRRDGFTNVAAAVGADA